MESYLYLHKIKNQLIFKLKLIIKIKAIICYDDIYNLYHISFIDFYNKFSVFMS